MASAAASLSPVFLAAALLLLSDAATADLCAKTDYKALCASVVKGEANAVAATAKAIEATLVRLRNAKSRAARLAATQHSSGKANADTCKQAYDEAIDALTASLKDLKHKDKGGLSSNLSAVLSDVSTCDDSYTENGEESPLARLNASLRKLASNNLALADEMHVH